MIKRRRPYQPRKSPWAGAIKVILTKREREAIVEALIYFGASVTEIKQRVPVGVTTALEKLGPLNPTKVTHPK